MPISSDELIDKIIFFIAQFLLKLVAEQTAKPVTTHIIKANIPSRGKILRFTGRRRFRVSHLLVSFDQQCPLTKDYAMGDCLRQINGSEDEALGNSPISTNVNANGERPRIR
jgi:hypothetical protein